MRRFVWLLLAAVSCIGLGATRPRYGGTLRVETARAPGSLDPAEWPQGAAMVFDRLPALASSWQHDAESKRWEFRLRPGIRFHDGSPLSAEATAAALGAANSDWSVRAAGDTVVIQLTSPNPNLLARGNFVYRRSSDGTLIGTGPFRLAKWEAGKRADFMANDEYWEGRPFLDAIAIEMNRPLREQLIDLELDRADVIEIAPNEVRRATQSGAKVWSSAPIELMALVLQVDDDRIREAVALSIDRTAIHNVLLQKQGAPAATILPQWISGYAFLFSAARDLQRARQLIVQTSKPAQPISLSYDASDPLARAVAERVALNVRETGLPLRTGTGASEAALVRWRISPDDPLQLLKSAGRPEALYNAEREILQKHRVIPLFHLPETYGLSTRVKNWTPLRSGEWRLAQVWLERP